ncbi:ATP synthase subunit I [Kaistella flava (ex Peng et al. 2021)]|uniref:ATP synthase subunit I n=1 Tax=Kaistella flava (ex Peng et al. 2021) TaxID=2038776 RepID=A0A7M2YDT9_9FLAO|nr:ATP synthase subunit I [Kaistella flava (ex Peng et al. 2021)]QOW11814.1 ATP synthase subunit I [Kaistella flava (ex Peng et al. 2021)]
MNEVITMILVFLTGALLGIIFFGGLWFTVKKSVNAKLPALLIMSSLFLRMSITVIGFYLIGNNNWQRLLLCLLGFIAARSLVLYVTKIIDEKQLTLNKEEIHETQS